MTLRAFVIEIDDNGDQSVMDIFERERIDVHHFVRFVKRMITGAVSNPAGSKRRLKIEKVEPGPPLSNGPVSRVLYDKEWTVPERYEG